MFFNRKENYLKLFSYIIGFQFFTQLPICVENRTIAVATNTLKESVPHSTFRQRETHEVKEISSVLSVRWRRHLASKLHTSVCGSPLELN